MVSIISAIDKNTESLLVGIKDFSADKIYLLTEKNTDNKSLLANLDVFKVKYELVELKKTDWDESFQKLIMIIKKENKKVVLNCSTSDADFLSLLFCVGFIDGVKMYRYYKDKVILIPTINASYYDLLTTKKEEILNVLAEGDCCKSMEELSKKTGMSLPLISYHINGNLRTQGLKALGLVVTKEEKGRIKLSLSHIGKLMIEAR